MTEPVTGPAAEVWRLPEDPEDADFYRWYGAWQPLGAREQATEFVLPGGFSARLTELGTKSLRDGFGREAQLTSQLVRGEVTPVLIDHDGNRHELALAA